MSAAVELLEVEHSVSENVLKGEATLVAQDDNLGDMLIALVPLLQDGKYNNLTHSSSVLACFFKYSLLSCREMTLSEIKEVSSKPHHAGLAETSPKQKDGNDGDGLMNDMVPAILNAKSTNTTAIIGGIKLEKERRKQQVKKVDITRAVRIFPCISNEDSVRDVFDGIAQRNGSPRIICFLGHCDGLRFIELNNCTFCPQECEMSPITSGGLDAGVFLDILAKSIKHPPQAVVLHGCASHGLAQQASIGQCFKQWETTWLGYESNIPIHMNAYSGTSSLDFTTITWPFLSDYVVLEEVGTDPVKWPSGQWKEKLSILLNDIFRMLCVHKNMSPEAARKAMLYNGNSSVDNQYNAFVEYLTEIDPMTDI